MTEFHGSFGGLWTDRLDAVAELDRRVAAGVVEPVWRDRFVQFIEHGFMVVEGAVPAAECDRLRAEQSDVFTNGSTAHVWMGSEARIPTLVPPNGDRPLCRVPDLYGPSPIALDVLLADGVVDVCEALFGEAPLLFQSLSFERGSQQPLHQDTGYVVVDPPMALVGAWIALDDIEPGSGELEYVVGSHRIPEFRFSGAFKHWNPARDGADQHEAWSRWIAEQCADLPHERFRPRKGDLLVWAADLVHGGAPVVDPESHRRSIVGHLCPVSATPHYFSIIPDRVKLPWGRGFVSSFYYDLSKGLPVSEPLLPGGVAPGRPAEFGPTPSATRMISYAQNAEDVVLRNAFNGQRRGFYIDIGANHPVDDSVTKYFSELGWRGINVEPVTALHAALVADRPRDINLCVAVGEESGVLEFGEVASNPGLSTFNTVLATNNENAGLPIVRRQVPIRTLADICAEHVTGEIDFLKVDVEGFEGQVFRGNDWSRFRPKVMLAESNFSETWHDFVLAQGYTQTLHDGLNRFYVRNDLLDTIGRRLNRPAVHAVDAYDPWYYLRQLHAAGVAASGGESLSTYRRLRRIVGRVVRRALPRR